MTLKISLDDKESLIAWLLDDQEVAQGLVNVDKLLALVAWAMEEDGHHVDGDAVAEVFLGSISDYEARTGYSAGDAAARLISPVVVYACYAGWEEAIAQMLGVPGVDTQPDWAAHHTRTDAAMKALSAIGMRAMLVASTAYEEKHGHSMMEVFMASYESGEDFDQSQTRLTAQRKGLRKVH